MLVCTVWYTAVCSSAVFVLFRMNSGPCSKSFHQKKNNGRGGCGGCGPPSLWRRLLRVRQRRVRLVGAVIFDHITTLIRDKALAGCRARKRAPAGKRLALRGGSWVRVANAVPLTPGTHRPSQVRHQRPIDHVHNERLVCVIHAVVTHENHNRAPVAHTAEADVGVAMREAIVAQVDADALQGLALRLVERDGVAELQRVTSGDRWSYRFSRCLKQMRGTRIGSPVGGEPTRRTATTFRSMDSTTHLVLLTRRRFVQGLNTVLAKSRRLCRYSLTSSHLAGTKSSYTHKQTTGTA